MPLKSRRGAPPRAPHPNSLDHDQPIGVSIADADWDTQPCPGHLPFESSGPAISAEPWPEPGRPPKPEPRYASVRVSEISAACGSLEVAYALLDLERDLASGGVGPASGDGGQ